MSQTAPQDQSSTYVQEWNALIDEYVTAICTGDRVKQQQSASRLDAMIRESAENAAIFDALNDFVDAGAVVLRIADEPGVRAEGQPGGVTVIHVEHTEHVRGGVHETARDALLSWASSLPVEGSSDGK